MKDYRIASGAASLLFSLVYLSLLFYDITVMPQERWSYVAFFITIAFIASAVFGVWCIVDETNYIPGGDFSVVMSILVIIGIILAHNVIMHTHGADVVTFLSGAC